MNSSSQARGGAVAADVIGSLQSLLGTVVIAVFVITFIVQAFQIPSESMMNTLLVGDYLLVNKLCYGGGGLGDHLMPYQKVSRGDIVVFHYPVDPQQHFVKRVIGVPGDHLRLVNKQVWINGKPLRESYVRFLEPPNNMYRDNFPRLDIPAVGLEGKWWLEIRLRDHAYLSDYAVAPHLAAGKLNRCLQRVGAAGIKRFRGNERLERNGKIGKKRKKREQRCRGKAERNYS
jgi:signal peptidase I